MSLSLVRRKSGKPVTQGSFYFSNEDFCTPRVFECLTILQERIGAKIIASGFEARQVLCQVCEKSQEPIIAD
eukprot:2563249-Amphidinium_carterae.1